MPWGHQECCWVLLFLSSLSYLLANFCGEHCRWRGKRKTHKILGESLGFRSLGCSLHSSPFSYRIWIRQVPYLSLISLICKNRWSSLVHKAVCKDLKAIKLVYSNCFLQRQGNSTFEKLLTAYKVYCTSNSQKMNSTWPVKLILNSLVINEMEIKVIVW